MQGSAGSVQEYFVDHKKQGLMGCRREVRVKTRYQSKHKQEQGEKSKSRAKSKQHLRGLDKKDGKKG